jgi:hypothetical protein
MNAQNLKIAKKLAQEKMAMLENLQTQFSFLVKDEKFNIELAELKSLLKGVAHELREK